MFGNDLSVAMANSQGHFQLNVFKPVILHNVLESIDLLADACRSFDLYCARGLEPNLDRIRQHVEESLMLVTALNPHIGYEKSAAIALKAHREHRSSCARRRSRRDIVTAEQFDRVGPSRGDGKPAPVALSWQRLVRFEKLILIAGLRSLVAGAVSVRRCSIARRCISAATKRTSRLAAMSIATTGRNVNGDRFPLFFNLADPLGDPVKMPWGDTWYHPMLFYLIAIALKFAALSDAAVRLPTAFIGGVVTPISDLRRGPADAIRRSRARWPPRSASRHRPTQLILSRQALDYVLTAAVRARRGCGSSRTIIETAADCDRAIGLGLILGVGCYSYIASWGVMPILLAMSWLAIWRRGKGRLARRDRVRRRLRAGRR